MSLGFTNKGIIILTVNNITKKYQRNTVLNQVSFRIPRHKISVILGPNGSGKTTLFKILMGLEQADSGDFQLGDDQQASTSGRSIKCSALLDASWCDPQLIAVKHLNIMARYEALPKEVVSQKVQRIGLQSAIHKKIGDYSLGMLQRLGIGTMLLPDSDLLIFDEPVNGLDPDGIIWLKHLFQELVQQGTTLLLSSHLLKHVEEFADYIVVIGKGHILEQGYITDLVTKYQHEEITTVKVQSAYQSTLSQLLEQRHLAWEYRQTEDCIAVSGISSEALGQLCFDEQIPLQRLMQEQLSLEQVYIRLTAQYLEYSNKN